MKKASYYPVTDQLSRPRSKHLAQGSLGSSNSSTVKSPKASPTMSAKATLSSSLDLQGGKKPGVKPKVICHSPQVVLSNIGNQRSIKVERIPVDVPPTIFVTSEDKSNTSAQGDSGICNGSNIAGSPLDLSSSAKVVHVKSESFDHLPYPGTQAHVSKIKTERSASVKNHVKGLTKEVPAASTTDKSIKKRKKPSVKVVESRYKSASTKKPSEFSQSSTLQRTAHSSMSQRTRSAKPPSLAKPHLVEETPKTKTRKDVLMAKASTPSAGFKTFFESDVSQIAPYKHNAENGVPSPKPKASNTKVHNEETSQSDIEFAFSEYLRICYVNSAMKQAHNKTARKALADLTLLCNENAQLQKEVAALEEEVITLEHQQELESKLDAQITALGPAVNKLPLTIDKYSELAINVDATRHALPLDGVVIPDEKQLESALNRSKEILGELSTLIYTHVDSCSEAAEKCQKLDETTVVESTSLDGVEELVQFVTSQAVKEANLRFQVENELDSADIEFA